MKPLVTVEEWVERFRAVGLSEEAMHQWHRLFEKDNPEGHRSFLEWLGLPPDRVEEIRRNHR